jgi:hypothetical protein
MPDWKNEDAATQRKFLLNNACEKNQKTKIVF